MTTRTRVSGQVTHSGGSWIKTHTDGTIATGGGPTIISSNKCEDSTGFGEDHDLLITKANHGSAPLVGTVQGPYWRYEANNFVPLAFSLNLFHEFLGWPSESSDAARLQASTNPSRSYVNIPTFLGELKDYPRMVRDVGRALLNLGSGKKPIGPGVGNNAGHWYLGFQFGWAPLISDLNKLWTFQTAVDKRVDELNRLYSAGGLKRRMQLRDGTVQYESNTQFIESAFNTDLLFKIERITQAKRWGTIRWTPTSLPKYRTSKEQRDLAFKLIHGLNVNSLTETAWELLPWSWMIDWFGGVQNYLAAYNNAVPATAGPCNIMTTTNTTLVCRRVDNVPMTGGSCNSTLLTKARKVTFPSINTSLPFLSGNQLSILGALAITRYR